MQNVSDIPHRASCDLADFFVRHALFQSQNDNLFDRLTAKNGKSHFTLKSTNGQVIGSSQMYASESGMENGITSVQNNAPGAEIVEV